MIQVMKARYIIWRNMLKFLSSFLPLQICCQLMLATSNEMYGKVSRLVEDTLCMVAQIFDVSPLEEV